MLVIKDLLSRFKGGDRRALARILSLVENQTKGGEMILRELFPLTGKAFIIGVTGAPGVGKSSLVNALTQVIRKGEKRVGIIAIDPSSPFSGGAIFGDRIRMQNHTLDSGVFIRSMGSRGSLGGLSKSTRDAVRVMDAFGKDIIIIETLGVGQAELDVVEVADSTVVVLIPGAGDSIQAIKAGIMEIGDIFVVNKCDLEGAEKTVREVKALLEMQDDPWCPPVIRTSNETGEGFTMLWESLLYHQSYLSSSLKGKKRRMDYLKRELFGIITSSLEGEITKSLKDEEIEKIMEGEEDPYTLAQEILKRLRRR